MRDLLCASPYLTQEALEALQRPDVLYALAAGLSPLKLFAKVPASRIVKVRADLQRDALRCFIDLWAARCRLIHEYEQSLAPTSPELEWLQYLRTRQLACDEGPVEEHEVEIESEPDSDISEYDSQEDEPAPPV